MVLRIAEWANVLGVAPKICPKTTMPKEARCQAHAVISASFDISSSWNGNSFFDKFYKVQNFFPYAIPIVLDNEPPRM